MISNGPARASATKASKSGRFALQFILCGALCACSIDTSNLGSPASSSGGGGETGSGGGSAGGQGVGGMQPGGSGGTVAGGSGGTGGADKPSSTPPPPSPDAGAKPDEAPLPRQDASAPVAQDAGGGSVIDEPKLDAAPTPQSNEDLASALSVYLPFSEGSGTTTANVAGGGGAAQLVNGTQWSNLTPPKLSEGNPGSLSFDGVDDFAQFLLPNSRIAVAYTFSLWFRIEGEGASRNIVTMTSSVGPQTNWGQQIRTSPAGAVEHHNTGMRNVIGTTPVTAGTWHHVAATGTRFGSMNLYLDGEEQGTAVMSVDLEPYDRFVFGHQSGGNAEFRGFFRGQLDDFAAFDRVLTRDQIRALARGQKPGTAPGR